MAIFGAGAALYVLVLNIFIEPSFTPEQITAMASMRGAKPTESDNGTRGGWLGFRVPRSASLVTAELRKELKARYNQFGEETTSFDGVKLTRFYIRPRSDLQVQMSTMAEGAETSVHLRFEYAEVSGPFWARNYRW